MIFNIVSCIYYYSSLREAKEVFPEQVSIDMIFGRPFQTLCEWIEELSEVYTRLFLFGDRMLSVVSICSLL